MQLNDQILEIDGVNYETLSKDDWCGYSTGKVKEEKAEMNIKIRRGEEVLNFDLVKQAYL